MDGVAPARAQQPESFAHNRGFRIGALHGEHRFTHDHIRTCLGKSRFLRGGINDDAAHFFNDPPDAGHRILVLIDSGIGVNGLGDNEFRGSAQAGGEFHHVRIGQLGVFKHGHRQMQATGAQYPLPRAGEHPVPGGGSGRTIRLWKRSIVIDHGFTLIPRGC